MYLQGIHLDQLKYVKACIKETLRFVTLTLVPFTCMHIQVRKLYVCTRYVMSLISTCVMYPLVLPLYPHRSGPPRTNFWTFLGVSGYWVEGRNVETDGEM